MYAKLVTEQDMLVSDSANPARKKVLDEVAEQLGRLGYRIHRVMNAELEMDNAVTRSYTNSLLVNGTAYVPEYHDPKLPADDLGAEENALRRQRDLQAAEVYRKLGFEVVALPMEKMIFYAGAIHCLTKQVPAVVFPP
jgi:agmatine/peptidylarginine deiminase